MNVKRVGEEEIASLRDSHLLQDEEGNVYENAPHETVDRFSRLRVITGFLERIMRLVSRNRKDTLVVQNKRVNKKLRMFYNALEKSFAIDLSEKVGHASMTIFHGICHRLFFF